MSPIVLSAPRRMVRWRRARLAGIMHARKRRRLKLVVPANAGTQCRLSKTLDSRLRGNDGYHDVAAPLPNSAAMPNDPIWRWSATRIVAAIRSRDISAREAVEACIGRMAEVNPKLNAVTVDLS